MKKVSLITLASLLALSSAQGQITITQTNWSGAAGTNAWSEAGNWGNGLPDSNTERPRFYGTTNYEVDVDNNFTINGVFSQAGAAITQTLSGTGSLIIDNSQNTSNGGVRNASNNGGTLLLNTKVTIANSKTPTPDVTIIENTNNSGNTIRFDTGSTLEINTLLRTEQGAGGSIQMNGTFASSAANLQINSTNVSFGDGHNSNLFGRDIVLLGGSKLAVDGGTVLNTGRKFQVNGNAELELNGADAINNANIVVDGTNNLLLDVNSNQANMGFLKVGDGVLTIDLDATVGSLFFADSSAQTWGTGTIAINGFKEGVIQFGADASGLSEAQLTAIDGGAYSLTGTGFLTAVPEPGTFALMAGMLALGLVVARRKRS